MTSLVPLIQIEVLIGTVCSFVFLYLQVRSYLRHKRKFFATLAVSSVFVIASTAMGAFSYFVPMPEAQSLLLYSLSIPLAILATALATWGSVQFFQAFDEKSRTGGAT